MSLMNPPSSLPPHIGPSVLPDFPLFHRLLFFAHTRRNIAIHDVCAGIQATNAQLMSDICHCRNYLLQQLPPRIQARLTRGQDVAICLLARGSYEFAVALFAIIALGAIAVPMSVAVPLKEAAYFVQTTDACAVLCTSDNVARGAELAREITSHTPSSSLGSEFFSIDVSKSLGRPVFPPGDIIISCNHHLTMEDAALVIFTSGTTGAPKAAVKKRSFFVNNSEAFANWWSLSESDVVLHILPVHHATGMSVTFLAPIMVGATIEFGASSNDWRFSPAAMWERWLTGGLTVFSGVPTMYQRMMTYYDEEIARRHVSVDKSHGGLPRFAADYARAAQAFRLLLCGSSALPYTLHSKWIKLLGGGNKRILERYGGTEFSGVFSVQPGDVETPDGSCGKLLPGIDVKLSEGERGEILIKSPHMFTEYLKNPKATQVVFTPDGWYKSGDVARREGPYYFIMGRANVDIIKSGGIKLSALEIEREIVDLNYVAEAVVVGVKDEEFGERVAAAVIPNKTGQENPITISQLRADLRKRLSSYKLPHLLRIIDDFPRTASGKVIKPRVRETLFPQGGHADIQYSQASKARL